MNKNRRNKIDKLKRISCDRMCDQGVWTKADHKALHNALDAYADEVRGLTPEPDKDENQRIEQKTLQFRGHEYTVSRVREGQGAISMESLED